MATYELVQAKAQAAKQAAAKLAVTSTAVKNAALLASDGLRWRRNSLKF